MNNRFVVMISLVFSTFLHFTLDASRFSFRSKSVEGPKVESRQSENASHQRETYATELNRSSSSPSFLSRFIATENSKVPAHEKVVESNKETSKQESRSEVKQPLLSQQKSFLNLDFLKKEQKVENKSAVDRNLDLFEAKVLDAYRLKNERIASQVQGDVYVQKSFNDVYQDCKKIVAQDPSLTPFKQFVKSFNKAVSITVQLSSLKSKALVGRAVEKIQKVADRFNALSEKDQQVIVQDVMNLEQNTTFNPLDQIRVMEQKLQAREVELKDQRALLQAREQEFNLKEAMYKSELSKAQESNQMIDLSDMLSDATSNRQKLEKQIVDLQNQNRDMNLLLESQTQKSNISIPDKLVESKEQKLEKKNDIFILQDSKMINQQNSSLVSLQAEFNKLKDQNALLLRELELSRQSSTFKSPEQAKMSKEKIKQEDGLVTERLTDTQGNVVEKISMMQDGMSIYVQEAVVLKNPYNDAIITREIYTLNPETGVRLSEAPAYREVETYVDGKNGNKILQRKEMKDSTGKTMIDYIPAADFNIGQLYDVSLLGVKRSDNFTIKAYEKITKNGLEQLSLNAIDGDGKPFEITIKQTRGKNQNEVINKITMQAFKKELGPDGLPIKNGLPKAVNETVTKNKEGLVEKKLVQIEGQTKVIEYLYDVATGKVKAEIVGQVKNKQLIPESQVNKEYTTDSKGNEIVTDMNEHETILKVTNNGQQVAGLYGIPLDVIFNETLLLQILKDQSFDTMSASQREAKVNSIVEDVKKAIQDNVQQILNTDAVTKMSNYSELEVQQVVKGALNKFNQMYDSNINQFLKTSAEKFVKELPLASQPVVEIKQQNQQQRSGLLLKQRETKIKEQARKVAEDQKKNEIKQEEMEKAAKQVESYTQERNNALLIAYLTSRGIMLSPQAGAVYLKLAQDAEVQRLTDAAVVARTREVKNAGNLAFNSAIVSTSSKSAPKVQLKGQESTGAADGLQQGRSAMSFMDQLNFAVKSRSMAE